MKSLIHFCVATAAAAGALLGAGSSAYAQNAPGSPDGIFQEQFRLKEHPQMPFAASAPSAKYQHGAPSALRRQGDMGDPNGCNLKCPQN
ncbi:hypothetical protein QS306_04825 [Paraburkholderia bonniea]|uniref:hypothetical protein n=1 Tax=Paraburkholderia bonniea TaxID=2152891 RepID=UPI001291894F|nr:hypothetical protein [Paraburkholderia bonniea]WJF90985.1 hypothetical protein QS306_04825 [Paraburkholderia bonniea]WJF94299.1 hypothetical protein QS308_04830 [Paraburkholderia bonniea]